MPWQIANNCQARSGSTCLPTLAIGPISRGSRPMFAVRGAGLSRSPADRGLDAGEQLKDQAIPRGVTKTTRSYTGGVSKLTAARSIVLPHPQWDSLTRRSTDHRYIADAARRA